MNIEQRIIAGRAIWGSRRDGDIATILFYVQFYCAISFQLDYQFGQGKVVIK